MMMEDKVLVKVRGVKKYFPIERGLFRARRGDVRAVDGVSFDVYRGEVLGLAGESGCGKSTLARLMLALLKPDEGEISFEGRDIHSLNRDSMRNFRRKVQLIFQDPYTSLDPRMRISDILTEPLIINRVGNKAEKRQKVENALSRVNLDLRFLERYPNEFSGGERQRIGIARALMTHPEFLLCDEPVSSLDVSIQAQILKLLRELRKRFSLTYLFITHDLRVLESVSDRVMVMYLGKIVESGRTRDIYERPLHPYTMGLIGASKRGGRSIKGDVASNIDPPSGCRFRTRCEYAKERCSKEEPAPTEAEPGHFVSCHYPVGTLST